MSLETQAGREKTASLMVSLPDTWYIYLYLLPDDTVFYVGKGKGHRLFQHETEAANGCDCRKCTTIRDIWASGNPVKKRIVFETFIEKEALTREKELIRQYFSEHLTNVQLSMGTKSERSTTVKVRAYIKYANRLRESILAGCYGSEGRLPKISDLSYRYETNTNTVLRALTYLVGGGLIEKRGDAYYIKSVER